MCMAVGNCVKTPPRMHPILFRIPLPHRPLMLWWALAAGALIAVVYALFARRSGEKGGAVVAGFVAIGAAVGAYLLRTKSYEASAIPIYSYGVMLGLSLVIGWYITLTLAERDGLPKETMANCYVITAVAAVVGSRILYVVTNLDEFQSFGDMFAFRRGGLVAYGGFLGGYLGAWGYLAANKIKLMPWADVAVPSLASGLMVSRIGCYLFGCDFGRKLPDGAPGFLQKLGTFPHWAKGTLENGDGSPAFVRHEDIYHLPSTATASLPVHPTQLYESLCGLFLLVLLLWQRKHQKFRGQIFFTFAFGYGVLRFILEMLRDDVERGEYGPMMPEHVLVPGALLLMSLGFCFGIAIAIKDKTVRAAARVLGFVPPVVAYLVLRPPSFGDSVSVMLSTSQWIGVLSALTVSYFYAQYWQAAKNAPKLAMSRASLGDFAGGAARDEAKETPEDGEGSVDEPEDEYDDNTAAEAPRAKQTKGLKKGLKKRQAAPAKDEKPAAAAEPVKPEPPAAPKADEPAPKTEG
jgi:phosphatidylglycerol---prolipoprotein diacylglyceryl transferase